MDQPRDPQVFQSDVGDKQEIVVCSTKHTADEARRDAIMAGSSAENFGTRRLQFQCPTFPGFSHFVFEKRAQDARTVT